MRNIKEPRRVYHLDLGTMSIDEAKLALEDARARVQKKA